MILEGTAGGGVVVVVDREGAPPDLMLLLDIAKNFDVVGASGSTFFCNWTTDQTKKEKRKERGKEKQTGEGRGAGLKKLVILGGSVEMADMDDDLEEALM